VLGTDLAFMFITDGLCLRLCAEYGVAVAGLLTSLAEALGG